MLGPIFWSTNCVASSFSFAQPKGLRGGHILTADSRCSCGKAPDVAPMASAWIFLKISGLAPPVFCWQVFFSHRLSTCPVVDSSRNSRYAACSHRITSFSVHPPWSKCPFVNFFFKDSGYSSKRGRESCTREPLVQLFGKPIRERKKEMNTRVWRWRATNVEHERVSFHLTSSLLCNSFSSAVA